MHSNPDFRLLFESIPGLFLVLDPKLCIVGVSNAYLAATKTEREAILGRGIFEVFPDNPSDPTATGVSNLHDSLKRVLEDKAPNSMAVQKYDIQRPESEGGGFEEKYWSPVNSPVLDPSGNLIYIIHRVEDVTEFVKLKDLGNQQNRLAEELLSRTASMESEIYLRAQEVQKANKQLLHFNEELSQREKELQQLYKRLNEMNQLKSQFFANVSHELRTPLTLILAPIRKLLSKNDFPDKYRSDLEVVERNAQTLLKHVNDLLDVSKVEAGKMNLEYSEIDLSKLLQRIASHFDSVAKEKSISYFVEGPNILSAQVDSAKVERILLNLLSNAFKFVPVGGRVSCLLNAKEDFANIIVSDNGPGVPDSLRDAIFERFRQVNEGDTRSFGGTGLGLSIVKDFVDLHGGRISVSGHSGGGALFEVRIPLKAPTSAFVSTDQYTPISEATVLGTLQEFKNLSETKGTGIVNRNLPRVLVVEDNSEMREYIYETLKGEFNVNLAVNGKDGLEKAVRFTPDLIVTDVMMPIMSGEQMVRELRAIPDLTKTPILLVSAKTEDTLRIRLLQEGGQDYLLKPFAPEELLARARNFIRLKKSVDDLEILNKELEAFSFSISHDLRAPIRGIEGVARFVLEDYSSVLDAEGLRMVNVILSTAVHMSNLVDDLLSFHKVTKLEAKFRNINMLDLVQEVTTTVKNAYPNTEYNLVIEELPSAVGDVSMIRQVWVNLISNAFKYTSKKEKPEIRIGCRRGSEEDTYFVKDNGAGFNDKYSNKLFKVFQRLHSNRDFDGTGVGLAIVERIIRRHGGKVRAEGAVNQGATFYFTLPKIV
ncbi:GHKL domain protein [Leptospira inadai serovar Lyme str. 10]|uniref:histidine kinase n=2 Tax=Leptospira inadai serovar Lyme TaxID=293084 RepID=V6HFC7_9LEPT|nr:ATP-binding protein [Leptospira inadai]EQA38313.1 GHKL domain protein [Leptospira inadai serovar Lyme str. 10]PNV74431.1 histidine kinase [Leptospira inadai serovar Lyme]